MMIIFSLSFFKIGARTSPQTATPGFGVAALPIWQSCWAITICLERGEDSDFIRFHQISSNPHRVQYFSGLPDAATVLFLEALLSKFELQYHSDWTVQFMPLIDQLFLTLIKL